MGCALSPEFLKDFRKLAKPSQTDLRKFSRTRLRIPHKLLIQSDNHAVSRRRHCRSTKIVQIRRRPSTKGDCFSPTSLSKPILALEIVASAPL